MQNPAITYLCKLLSLEPILYETSLPLVDQHAQRGAVSFGLARPRFHTLGLRGALPPLLGRRLHFGTPAGIRPAPGSPQSPPDIAQAQSLYRPHSPEAARQQENRRQQDPSCPQRRSPLQQDQRRCAGIHPPQTYQIPSFLLFLFRISRLERAHHLVDMELHPGRRPSLRAQRPIDGARIHPVPLLLPLFLQKGNALDSPLCLLVRL